MAVINWKWSEMSLIKVRALLSISTLVFTRSNLVFHAYVFFIIQILMTFGQIWYPTYFWTIMVSDFLFTSKVQILPPPNAMSFITNCSDQEYSQFLHIWSRKLFNFLNASTVSLLTFILLWKICRLNFFFLLFTLLVSWKLKRSFKEVWYKSSFLISTKNISVWKVLLISLKIKIKKLLWIKHFVYLPTFNEFLLVWLEKSCFCFSKNMYVNWNCYWYKNFLNWPWE